MARGGRGWPLGVVVGLLALVGVGASVAHYLQKPCNRPLGLTDHRGGALGLGRTLPLAGPLPGRHAHPLEAARLSRHSGKLLVAIGVVVGATVLFMGFVI